MNSTRFKLRFGVIGTNFVTDWMLEEATLDPRFELTAVYSRSKEKAEQFARKYGVANTFTSLEEMAASSLIDAVYIASPNAFHAEQSILFMEHGKHVLCEKAFASNAREAQQMIDTARVNKVVLMEAMKLTLTPAFISLRDNLKEIGTIRRYFASYCKYSSRYDRFKEGKEIPNAFKPELSNGALMDIGVYTIYPMVALFGRPDSICSCGLKLSTGVDGQGAVNFGYKSMNASVIYSKISDSFLPVEFQGENGIITMDSIHSPKKVELCYRNGKKVSLGCLSDVGHGFAYEISEFISIVEDGKIESEINSHANSLAVMSVMDEIRRQTGVIYLADNKR